MFFGRCETWFFDFGRSWFFDLVGRPGKIRLSSNVDVRLSSNVDSILKSNVNTLKNRIGSIPKDTADLIRLEAKSTVETSSNAVSKFEALESLDVACVLVGEAVNLITCLDKGKLNVDGSTSEQLNPILTRKMLTTKSTKFSNVGIERISLTSKVGITHGELNILCLNHGTILICLVSRNISVNIKENRILECNNRRNLHNCKYAPFRAGIKLIINAVSTANAFNGNRVFCCESWFFDNIRIGF